MCDAARVALPAQKMSSLSFWWKEENWKGPDQGLEARRFLSKDHVLNFSCAESCSGGIPEQSRPSLARGEGVSSRVKFSLVTEKCSNFAFIPEHVAVKIHTHYTRRFLKSFQWIVESAIIQLTVTPYTCHLIERPPTSESRLSVISSRFSQTMLRTEAMKC